MTERQVKEISGLVAIKKYMELPDKISANPPKMASKELTTLSPEDKAELGPLAVAALNEAQSEITYVFKETTAKA